jgi:hypothetical protein
MILLVLAAALVYGSLLAATLLLERGFFFSMFDSNQPVVTVVLSVLIVPTLTTWATAEVVNAAFHKRMLDRRVRRRASCLAAGFGAGFFGVLIGTLMLILLDRTLPDALLMGLAAAASTAIVLMPLPRQRPFGCPNCGYDLSGASPASGGVCTECGFAVMNAGRKALPGGRGSPRVSA